MSLEAVELRSIAAREPVENLDDAVPPLGVEIGSEIVDILAVDDQPEVLDLLKRQLERKGFSVRTAGDAFEASRELAACRPRVILLDLMMPRIDGAAFLERLRTEHSPASLPVIVLTASDLRQDMLRCLDAGANDFMLKPVDLDALIARVEVQIAVANRFRVFEESAALLSDASEWAREAVWTWRPKAGEFLTSANFAVVCGAARKPASFEEWVSSFRLADAKDLVAGLHKLREGKIERLEAHVLCGLSNDRALLIRAGVEGRGRDERISGAVVDVTEPFLRDATSQLPAEGAFMDRLAARRAQGRSASLLVFDIRRFDELIAAHGVVGAEDALQLYLSAVRRATAPVGELFRLSATEFAVVLNPSSGALRALAWEIAGGEKFGIQTSEGQIHRVSSAVGVVSDSLETPEETRFRARLALKAALESGIGGVREYTDELREERLRQARLEARLSVALALDAISVIFQPVADAATQRWLGIEASPRWVDPTLGQVPSRELIAAAELIGRSFELFEIMARQAFEVGGVVNRDAEEPLFVALKAPGSCAKNPALPSLVAKLAREEGVEPSDIVLEVSEDDVLGDYEACAKVFRSLNQLGVRVAIDDFGSSYSSLTYLSRVPSQILKVDEAMLEAAEERADARSLLGTTSRMAKHLGKRVVLNGVSEATQMQVAREVGADMVQGALTARPMDGDDVILLVRSFR
jgi:EAL domain-containing protein (putative c-di-GMP-specific phosphodiesterase class I)/CheY-like chemotaxis protein